MTNMRRPEPSASREVAPLSGETYHPALVEPIIGEYYYGHAQAGPAMARSYWQVLYRRRWTIIIVFLAIMSIGAGMTFTRPRLYRSRAEMLVAPVERHGAPGSNFAESVGVLTRVRSVATEVKMLQSPDLLDEAFEALPEELRRAGFGNGEQLHRYPINVINPKDTDVVAVEVIAHHPEAAAEFANQILQTNLDRHRRTTESIAVLATQQIDAELNTCDRNLRKMLDELADLKTRNKIVDVGEQVKADAAYLASLESESTRAEVERERANMTREMLKRELAEMKTVVEDTRVAAENPLIKTINEEIERLQQRRAELMQEYKPTAPEIRAVDEQIAQAKRRQQEMINSKTETVTVKRNPLLDNLRQSYIDAMVSSREAESRLQINRTYAQQVRGRMTNLPQSEKRIALLNSRIAELQSTHAYLVGQKQAVNLSMYRGLPSVMPFTHARPNDRPVSPNIPASLGIFFVMAALLAVGIALLREQVDDRVHDTETLEMLTGQRVLTSLPRVRTGFRGLVTKEDTPAELLESFRILRGNILLSLDPLPRVIAITSARAGEGKSTTAANLAATIAISGKRVLLIDCDMRHPSAHLQYGVHNDVGLSTVLQGQTILRESLQQTDIENLQVLPAGPTPSHPPELLASADMAVMIDGLRESYDSVILDSTPIVNLSDGSLVASLADGVLMVVSSEQTRQPDLLAALRSLEQIGATVLGIVCNRSLETPALEWDR